MSPQYLPPDDQLPAAYSIIRSWIEPKSQVLDLGCGNGNLLAYLQQQHQCRGEGVELSRELVSQCVNRGLPVHHGDIDEGLGDYPDQRFDVVLLSHTLQEVANPTGVIDEILRVGKMAILSYPNFAYWRVRAQLLFLGRAPRTPHLPFSWFESPNRHVLSVSDFEEYCEENKIEIVRSAYLSGSQKISFWPNLFAETALAAIRRKP